MKRETIEISESNRRTAVSPFLHLRSVQSSESSVDSDSNWLITLSDVLSLLLVFFIMFFVMTKNTGKNTKVREESSGEALFAVTGLKTSPPTAAEKIRSEMNSLIRDLKMEKDVSVETIRKGIVITLKENVTFRPGEAEILKDSGPVLDNIAGIIRRHPSYAVEIDGHTDNVPIRSRLYPSNWELSVARAASVLRYFIGIHGIDPSHLSIKGNADHRPVVPNDTPEQRAQNRRVEIRLRELEVDQ